MAGITGMGDTFDLPNFVGPLFGISPQDTPLLSSIGGLTGGKQVNAKEFEWEYYDLRDAAVGRERLEGADAPTAEERVRANASNVLQIVQEAVSVSYTKLAATGQLDAAVLVQGTNPVTNEFDWQVDKQLIQIARDINYSMIRGTYAKPADNSTPRKTRGLLSAIATNVITPESRDVVVTGEADTELFTATAHGLAVGDRVQFSALTGGAGLAEDTDYYVRSVPSANTFTLSATRGGAILAFTTDVTGTPDSILVSYPRVTTDYLGDAMQAAFRNGGLALGETRIALVGAHQKRRLTQALVTDASYQETSRNVGGVNVTNIETDFGDLGIMVDRAMPDDTISLVSLEELSPVFLLIPGKGFLFVEPLSKTGSAENAQIYGEWGLEYGNERKHSKLTGLG